MYNTYLLPVYDAELILCYIEHVNAVNLEHAREKFIEHLSEDYNISVNDWEELELQLCEQCNIIIGEIYDKEEF